MQVHPLQGKEVFGFFWFRSELTDALDATELEQLLMYFSKIYDLYTFCFNKKMLGAPIFRFKQSPSDPTQLMVSMLRVNDESIADAVLAQKTLQVQGNYLSLQLH